MSDEQDWRGRGHEEVLMDLGPQEWQQWRHSPVTSAFLGFLRDRLALCRENAASMVELGLYDIAHQVPDRNPNVMRGQILTLDELQGLTIEAIQGFYREKRDTEEDHGRGQPDLPRGSAG